MPMQVFEFQADATVSLASPAAINRKSCDHCFLNRKTCDKVRQSADSGEKCRRCAKDNRPCTFTPTVHLYHIADCVGRHQCRAKVLQAMGGNRKKEVQYKTIEIPLVCDMDSPLDQALFDFIQRQPNLLVYNNRIKSFLAQDMLGISPDCEDVSLFLGQAAQSQAPSSLSLNTESAPYHGASIFNNNSGPVNSAPLSTSGPSMYGPMSMIEHPQAQPVSYQLQPQQHQQHQRPHPYAQHQKTNSEDRGRRSPRSPHSPMGGAVFNYHHAARPTEPSAAAAVVSIPGGRVSPIPSPHTLGPMDTTHYLQRRPSSEALAAATAMVASASATTSLANANHSSNHAYVDILQQQQQHPYARQSPYPMAFTQQQQQQQQFGGYRVSNSYPPSPLAPSPLAPSPVQNSPVPPSPLELSLSISTNFGVSPNSHQNLPSLFDTSLNMSSATNTQSSQVQMLQQQQQHQYHHHRQLSASSISSPLTIQQDNRNPLQIGNCGNAMGDITLDIGSNVTTSAPAPLVITTTDDKGDEVGFYYAVPSVSLNPGCTDSDLFQDFPMIDPLGESFVWIENLFDEKLTGVVKTEMTLADEIQGCHPPSDIFVQDRDVQDDEDEEEDDALMAAHGLLGTATAMTGPVSINMASILHHPHHHSLYNIAEYLAAPSKTEPQFGDLIPAQTLQG
ncbi:hypothetical protein BGW38_002612 [Lunasporangiospora selenospora]|uniref:Zn(2)-C6 fungal-type domain-containing protein n=1 Tax=Lunasporangiospora selenospora TaxID=979761 RepID=A0A9P6FSZ8_9FUNG|nr:hypothetical protein BGW38_002612 [Lunasporangiospora selenospora]